MMIGMRTQLRGFSIISSEAATSPTLTTTLTQVAANLQFRKKRDYCKARNFDDVKLLYNPSVISGGG